MTDIAENSRATGAERARRRAAEAMRDGRRDAALDLARTAFALQPDDEETVRFCAWLFSNCADHAAAGAAYERLLALCPEWTMGHRHASGSFAAVGDIERAIFHGKRASDRDPLSGECAFHVGCLLEQAGRPAEAVFYLTRAAALMPESGAVSRRLSAALWEQGEREEAVALALRTWRSEPEDLRSLHHAAELLLRVDRLDEAAFLLDQAARRNPEDDAVLRTLSAAEMRRGDLAAALAAIEAALALAPHRAEYHVHRAGLLQRLGRPAAAAEAYDRAAAFDPANRALRRSQLLAYCDAGRIVEALSLGGELIRAAPDDKEYAEALLHVLNHHLGTAEGEIVAPGPAPRDFQSRGDPNEGALQPPRPPRTAAAALSTQLRVLRALIIRETRTRFGESRLGYGWALLEPVLHILMLSLVFAVMIHGRPPIGRHFFIFYYTGIIPYHLFVHTSSNMAHAITSNGALLQLPLVDTFDVILARALLELATDLVVAVILLAGFTAVGLPAAPRDLSGVAAALLSVWLFATGLGFCNAVVTVLWAGWDKVWAQITRILYFCSGIFYVPAAMPDRVRHILAWNPVLQAVDWFRAGFFEDYDPHWLARGYLVMLGLWTLLVGLALERSLRRRLFAPL